MHTEKQNNFDKPQLAAYVCQGTCYGAFTHQPQSAA